MSTSTNSNTSEKNPNCKVAAWGEEERPDANARNGLGLVGLYAAARDINTLFFNEQLPPPNLVMGRCGPRRLAYCAYTRVHPIRLQFILAESLVAGTNRAWIVRPYPFGEGMWHFIFDLILRFSVRQYVRECLQINEANSGGFGPHFIDVANRIGKKQGLRPVGRRRGKNDDRPAANGWPHCVRAVGYYHGDVTAEAVELACGGSAKTAPASPTPNQGLLELMQHLFQTGRMEDARRLVDGTVQWGRTAAVANWSWSSFQECGEHDEDGWPMGKLPAIQRKWLAWNGGTVRRMAESVQQCESYAELPLLADALEEAGCKDKRILDHLRAKIRHGCDCWVLRGLLGVGAQ